MTEGLAYDTTKLAERKVYFLLFVDVLQVPYPPPPSREGGYGRYPTPGSSRDPATLG
ncbi:hypothetical protein T484DRAFT_1772982 [Baffinella frigidus]|nr:hypothetical protein T484DRAFT_1772982 [Cryptophyta sp. CCMP2293]